MIDMGELTSAELAHALATLDPSALDFDGRLAAISGWEQIISFAQAKQNELLAELDRELADGHEFPADEQETPRPPVRPIRWCAEQLGVALGVSGTSAYYRVQAAVTLTEKLPHVHEALRTGQVTVHHARVAAKLAHDLAEDVARGVDELVMGDQEWSTPRQFERTMARAIIELDPDGAAERARAAKRRRRVSVRDEPDGMMSLWALLPAPQGQLVHKTLNAHARSSAARNTPGDHRTLDERRADALVELVIRRLTDGGHEPTDPTVSCDSEGDTANSGDDGAVEFRTVSAGEPTLHGHRPEIHVTIPWSTLIGCDNLPANLTGYGCIDADTGRRIAADPSSVWRRLIVDPMSGRLLDYGTTTYRPPADLRDFVDARDVYCVFPTCDKPAVLCELDHCERFPDGPTSAESMGPMCKNHHRLKHEGGWTYQRDPDTGDSIWTDPSGLQHTKYGTRLPMGQAVTPPVEQPKEPVEPPDEPSDYGPPPF